MIDPSPRTWMLDDTPANDLAEVLHGVPEPGVPFPAGIFHTSREVMKLSSKSPTRSRFLLRLENLGSLQVHDITYGSDTFVLYTEYRKGAQTDANRGEHEAIALCTTALTRTVFVAGDKLACWLALLELGSGRVATPYELWDDLKARRILTEDLWDKLCERTRKGQQNTARPWRHRHP